jgi:hypothetical protein
MPLEASLECGLKKGSEAESESGVGIGISGLVTTRLFSGVKPPTRLEIT